MGHHNCLSIASAAQEAGSVAELAAFRKMDKYTSLAADCQFQPIVVDMLGPVNKSASHFFTVVAHKISQCSGDVCLFASTPE